METLHFLFTADMLSKLCVSYVVAIMLGWKTTWLRKFGNKHGFV